MTGGTVKVSKKGVAKVQGALQAHRRRMQGTPDVLKGKGVTGAGKVTIKGKKTKSVKVKFSKSEVKKIRKAKRLGTAARLKIGDANTDKGRITLVR